jgi:hypothetical protein
MSMIPSDELQGHGEPGISELRFFTSLPNGSHEPKTAMDRIETTKKLISENEKAERWEPSLSLVTQANAV